MARFAIVRQDGEVDKVDGVSVDDVANRYGWPGNGDIQAWDDGAHNERLRYTFTSPEEQRETLADKPVPEPVNEPAFAPATPSERGIYRSEADFEAAVAAESERRASNAGSPTWQPADNGGTE